MITSRMHNCYFSSRTSGICLLLLFSLLNFFGNNNGQPSPQFFANAWNFPRPLRHFNNRRNNNNGYQHGDLQSLLEQPRNFQEWQQQQQQRLQQQQDKKTNESPSSYRFGDHTRFVLSRLRTLILVSVIKLVVIAHLEGFVIRRLPDKILLDIVRYCLAQDTRPKVLRVVSQEMDRRMRTFVDNYQFGDLTRGTVASMLGKKDYQFGDLTKIVLKAAKEHRLTTFKPTLSIDRELERMLQQYQQPQSEKKQEKMVWENPFASLQPGVTK